MGEWFFKEEADRQVHIDGLRKAGLPKRLREEGKDQLGASFGPQRVGEPAVADPGTVEKLKIDW